MNTVHYILRNAVTHDFVIDPKTHQVKEMADMVIADDVRLELDDPESYEIIRVLHSESTVYDVVAPADNPQ